MAIAPFPAAGIIGSGNPEGSNWKVFDSISAPGSWLLDVARAGHTTFMQPQAKIEGWLLERFFGGGKRGLGGSLSVGDVFEGCGWET